MTSDLKSHQYTGHTETRLRPKVSAEGIQPFKDGLQQIEITSMKLQTKKTKNKLILRKEQLLKEEKQN